MKTRFLRWGAPTSSAPSTSHSASNPISASPARTVSSPRLRSADTFSRKTYLGPTSRTTRRTSNHSPLRSPWMPARLPALLMSWQGKPAQTRSTHPRQGRPSKLVTSPWMGQASSSPSAIRAASTRWQYPSASTATTMRASGMASLIPRSNPPIPVNSERTRMILLPLKPKAISLMIAAGFSTPC